jgi:sugar/nucleoside kinase (ribokinase family)
MAIKVKYDLAVVGHIVLDRISRGNRQYDTQMGSPCVYTSLGARALNASVVVASKVGHDFGIERLAWLRSRGVDIDYVRHSNSLTTSFKIRYENACRFMWVASKCAPLTDRDLSDIPSSSALHIGPILGEISQSLAMSLTDRNSVTCLDPQGYLRRILGNGAIRKSK